MNRIWKRALALLLVVIMVGGAAPLTFGAEDGYKVGDTVVFGSYPQTDVTATMGAALNAQSAVWHSYGYYSGTGYWDGQMTAKDYMQYCDVTYGGQKYRGVRFSQYRPFCTGYTSSYTEQDDNGYYTGATYWFQYEPLQWRVLDPNTGLVLCETIIDSQPYNNYILSSGVDAYGNPAYWGDAGKTHYANNYAESSIRQWLNRDFYNTAFSAAQQAVIANTTLDNSAFSTSYSAYDSASTTDKVFLLSYSDMTNTAYGFAADHWERDPARQAQGSDYAKCQGLDVYSSYECPWWSLRSAGVGSHYACHVLNDGWVCDFYYVNYTFIGIRPALRLNLGSGIFASDIVSPTGTKVTITDKQQYIYVGGTVLSKTQGGQADIHQAACYSTTITKANVKPSDFTWSSGDESILKVTGSRYSAYDDRIMLNVDVLGVSPGTTTLTVRTSDGASASCVVNVVQNEYYICVYSSSEDFTTKANESFNLAFSLYKNGKPVQDWKKMALVVGNTDVIDVSDYQKAKDGQYYVTISGLKPGVSSLSVTDSDSKAHQLLTIKVEEGIIDRFSRRMDNVPTFYPDDSWDHNIPTQVYNVNGLYVNHYSLSPLKDGKYTVSFDVYNSKMHNGAVDVYDANGDWINSKKIERYQDASSIWDIGESYLRLISDKINGQMLTYMASSYSKETSISVEVPEGGYLTISNNVHDSPGAYMWNCIDLVFFAIEGTIDLVSYGVNNNKYKFEDKTIQQVFNKPEQTKKFLKRLEKNMEKASKKVSDKEAQFYLSNNVSEFENGFADCFGLTFKDVAKSAVGYAQDAFEELTGPIGAILKTFFAATKFIDRIGQGIHMSASYDRPYVTLYTPTNKKATTINGVTVQDNYNAVDGEAVLQVYKVAPSDEIEVSLKKKTSFDSYQTYNICFVKNDDQVQPNGKVTVKIPIPEGMNKRTCSVLRQEDNGEWTILSARVEGNYLVFETNHFSCYAIVGKTPIRIEIKSLPKKMTYLYGDILDASGLTVTVFYADGTQEELMDNITCSPMLFAETGEQTITVNYGNAEAVFAVNVAEREYKVSWVVDGQITENYYTTGATIKKPADPTKDGYTFKGWIPEVPSAMPAKNMTFTASFEKTPDTIVMIHNYTVNKTVDYRATITFTAVVTNPVSGATVHWFIDGQDKGAGETYTVKEAKQDFTVQARYMKDGDILAESETETVKVKSGFFAKLIAFFRGLFGRLPKVVQEYLGVERIDRVLP